MHAIILHVNIRKTIAYYRINFVSLQIWFVIVAALTLTTTACFVLNMYDDFRVDRENIPTLPNNATYNYK